MRKFAEFLSDKGKVQTVSALLSWSHKDINKPIGVSEYKLSDFVPAELIDTKPKFIELSGPFIFSGII